MRRRAVLKGIAAVPAVAAAAYAQKTRGLPPLTIKEVRVIATGAGGPYPWVFVKVITSEPGLYGIGSASHVYQTHAVIAAIEREIAPFWIGKDPDRIEDLWQASNVRSYWRNSTVINNVLSGLDMALWDIKGKRAGMPVYELLGGKVRDAVPVYAHAGGNTFQEVEDDVRQYWEKGFRHIRAQFGPYGGAGMVPPGHGSRPEKGFGGAAFDEELYVNKTVEMFEYLRARLGFEPKLLHDVHEHLTPIRAMELSRRLDPCQLFFLEDVLPPEQILWYREIRKTSTTPQAMGELFVSPLEWLPLVSERLIDFVRNRVSQTGGITPTRKLAAVAEAFGVRTAFQEGGDNDPVNQMAAYHIDMAISNFGIQEENHFPDRVYNIMPGTGVTKAGYLYGSGLPGLGIDINEEEARKIPFIPQSGEEDWRTTRSMDGSIVKP
jgi:mannonate dehydratase